MALQWGWLELTGAGRVQHRAAPASPHGGPPQPPPPAPGHGHLAQCFSSAEPCGGGMCDLLMCRFGNKDADRLNELPQILTDLICPDLSVTEQPQWVIIACCQPEISVGSLGWCDLYQLWLRTVSSSHAGSGLCTNTAE